MTLIAMQEQYQAAKARQHRLDLSRGRPAAEFLDLAQGLEHALPENLTTGPKDLRNYLGFPGLEAARSLGADLLQVPEESVLVGSNSSLMLLSWLLTTMWFKGLPNQPAWSKQPAVDCLCPVPGYDRHFLLLETFGIGMPTIELCSTGVDPEQLTHQLRQQQQVRAIMLVPRHSNPTGDVWSEESLRALMRAAKERAQLGNPLALLIDNAYAIHDFADTPDQPNLYQLADEYGVLDHFFLLGSTSKIGYAGSGLSFLSASPQNLHHMMHVMQGISLGGNPLDQARHARFFDKERSLRTHFSKLAPLLKTRFELVQSTLEPLAQNMPMQISKPTGGYFLSLQLPPNTASRTWQLCREAGVTLSAAGSAFPYNHDPKDSHLRIAPTSLGIHDTAVALEVFAIAAQLAWREQQQKG